MQRSYNRFCKSSVFVLSVTTMLLLFSFSVNASVAFSAEENDGIDQEEKIDYRPDRVLTKKERERIQKHSKTLLTKSVSPNASVQANWNVERGWAANELGYTHHKAALPALFAVLKDKTDPPGVRVDCACALKRINDKRVIEVLMDAALDDHYNVAAHAQVTLIYLVHLPFPGNAARILRKKYSSSRKP